MEEMYKFYLEVKTIVDRILIYEMLPNSLLYINEMVHSDLDHNDTKIFNGTIPMTLEKKKLILRFLGEEGETSYIFNELFSKPITEEILLKKAQKVESTPAEYIYRNIIIINTPKEIKYVIVEIPNSIQKLFDFPKYMFLTDVEQNKINLFPEKTSNADKLAKGVDPAGKTYIKYVDINLSKILNGGLTKEAIKILEAVQFKIFCYNWTHIKEFSFEKK